MRPLLAFVFALVLCKSCSPNLALAQDKQPPKPKLEHLLKEIKSDDAGARLEAIINVADYGSEAKAAVPDLLTALKVKDEDTRLNAAITLGKIGKAAVPAMLE